MLIDIIGNRIKIKFKQKPDLSTQYKLLRIPGGNESRDELTWSYPINMTVCRKARLELNPDDDQIGRALWDWAEEAERRAAIVAGAQGASEDDDRSPDYLLPNVKKYARPLFDLVKTRWYQVEGSMAMAGAQRMILADQPGLGKTYQALAGALEHHYEQGNYSPLILILAPTSVVTTAWEPSILDVVPGCFVYTMDGSRKQREGQIEAVMEEYDAEGDPGPRFVLGNPEMGRITIWYRCKYKDPETKVECGKEWRTKKDMIQAKDAEGRLLWEDRYNVRWWKNDKDQFVRKDETEPPEEYEPDFNPQMLLEPAMCLNSEHKQKRKHVMMEEASYESLLQLSWDTVILDESQKVLIANSSLKAKMSMQRRGMLRLRAELMFALTGTPYRGKPNRLWGTLNWLDPKGHPSYRKWLDSNFRVVEHERDEGYDVGGLTEESEEEFLRAQGAIMLRRTKAEVAKQLPPKQYAGWWLDPESQQPGGHGIWLPMEPAQARAYKSMRDDAVAALEGGTLNAIGVLAEITRLRQFSSSCAKMIAQGKDGQYVQPVLPSNKLNWCRDFLDQLDGKVVIVSQFTGLLNMFEIVLGRELDKAGWGKTTKITGDVAGRKRTEAQRAFQTDPETRLMLLNLQAGGVGIDLDAQCDDMIFLDEHYIPDDNEQAEDRIHRISNEDHTCTYHYLRSLGTIEEHIARTTGGRDVIQKRLLDGHRGVEFARTLV